MSESFFKDTKQPLTSKQQEIYDYIKEYVIDRGYPPTVRDIGSAVNLSSPASVHSQLEKLENKGYIIRDKTKPRAIEIVEDKADRANKYGDKYSDNYNDKNNNYADDIQKEVVSVPVIGSVAAGSPLFAEENIEDFFPIPAEYLGSKTTFMLKVRGDSMINIGIFDGDTIIVEQCQTASNGDVVVALIDDSATVKTFYKEKGHIRLQPENDDYEPIITDNCTILGKYIGLVRMVR